mgnify:CR=1 FL=1
MIWEPGHHLAPPPPTQLPMSFDPDDDYGFNRDGSDWVPFDPEADDEEEQEESWFEHPSLTVAERNPSLR